MKLKRVGPRYYEQHCELFSAVIFGAPAPAMMWAWGVWASKLRAEGISYSLAAARQKVAREIENLCAPPLLRETEK